jgi:hypothetical protein
MESTIPVVSDPTSYYERIVRHCQNIGLKLLTPKAVYDLQVGTQPTKRNITIRLGCHHACVFSKQAWSVFETRSNQCRLCRSSDPEELYQLAEQDIADGKMSQDQFDALNNDQYILACLRAKANKHNANLEDMVDIWLNGQGECARCGSELFPTASTRSFYFAEVEDDDSELEVPGDNETYGCFVCSMCKD